MNHKDGNKKNNAIENLECVTAQENIIHARVTGLNKGKGRLRKACSKKRWRVSIEFTKEQEDAIMKLRQTDEFCRCSFGEIIRRLIDAGLDESSRNDG